MAELQPIALLTCLYACLASDLPWARTGSALTAHGGQNELAWEVGIYQWATSKPTAGTRKNSAAWKIPKFCSPVNGTKAFKILAYFSLRQKCLPNYCATLPFPMKDILWDTRENAGSSAMVATQSSSAVRTRSSLLADSKKVGCFTHCKSITDEMV